MEKIIDYSEKCNWVLETLMADISFPPGDDFSPPGPTSIGDFDWPSQPINGGSSTVRVEVDCSVGVPDDGLKEVESHEQTKAESCSGSGSKAAYREKLRREKLNKRFLELAFTLEPGRKPKLDKAAILTDAFKMVTHLRSESQKLQDSNEDLQAMIKELKAEKIELRDELQKTKADKKRLERQIKAMGTTAPQHPGFPVHPSHISAAHAAVGQVTGDNRMPFIGYPSGVPMCRFMPTAEIIDTSEDDSC